MSGTRRAGRLNHNEENHRSTKMTGTDAGVRILRDIGAISTAVLHTLHQLNRDIKGTIESQIELLEMRNTPDGSSRRGDITVNIDAQQRKLPATEHGKKRD